MKALALAKKIVEKQLVRNANCTTSFHAYQPKVPNSLKKFKK